MNNQRHSPPKSSRKVYPPARSGGAGKSYGKSTDNRNVMIIIAVIVGILLIVGVVLTLRLTRKSLQSTPTMASALSGTKIPAQTQQGNASATAIASATATSLPAPVADPTPYPIDVPSLQRYMFNLVNEDRQKNGLSLVLWDNVAAQSGLNHAREMTAYQYLSHWDLDGFGPEYRYTQAGGLNISQENVYYYAHSSGGGAQSLEDWQALIASAQLSLMNSPGHRANILAPAHTHVGIGIDYDPSIGRLSISQEFVDKYVSIQPLPIFAKIGQTIQLKGRLNTGLSNPVINLAYESEPKHLSVSELNNTGVYSPPANVYQVLPLNPDTNGDFSSSFILNNQSKPGLYHVYIGVDDQFGSNRIILDFVINVAAQ